MEQFLIAISSTSSLSLFSTLPPETYKRALTNAYAGRLAEAINSVTTFDSHGVPYIVRRIHCKDIKRDVSQTRCLQIMSMAGLERRNKDEPLDFNDQGLRLAIFLTTVSNRTYFFFTLTIDIRVVSKVCLQNNFRVNIDPTL
jgi:hypothetical protein